MSLYIFISPKHELLSLHVLTLSESCSPVFWASTPLLSADYEVSCLLVTSNLVIFLCLAKWMTGKISFEASLSCGASARQRVSCSARCQILHLHEFPCLSCSAVWSKILSLFYYLHLNRTKCAIFSRTAAFWPTNLAVVHFRPRSKLPFFASSVGIKRIILRTEPNLPKKDTN